MFDIITGFFSMLYYDITIPQIVLLMEVLGLPRKRQRCLSKIFSIFKPVIIHTYYYTYIHNFTYNIPSWSSIAMWTWITTTRRLHKLYTILQYKYYKIWYIFKMVLKIFHIGIFYVLSKQLSWFGRVSVVDIHILKFTFTI